MGVNSGKDGTSYVHESMAPDEASIIQSMSSARAICTLQATISQKHETPCRIVDNLQFLEMRK